MIIIIISIIILLIISIRLYRYLCIIRLIWSFKHYPFLMFLFGHLNITICNVVNYIIKLLNNLPSLTLSTQIAENKNLGEHSSSFLLVYLYFSGLLNYPIPTPPRNLWTTKFNCQIHKK